MRERELVLRIRLPQLGKRWFLATVALIVGSGAIVYATVPNVFSAGDPLSATKVNVEQARLLRVVRVNPPDREPAIRLLLDSQPMNQATLRRIRRAEPLFHRATASQRLFYLVDRQVSARHYAPPDTAC